MSSDTIIKLARWRVRDLAACFSTCKLPRIDEEPNPSTSSTDHHRGRTKNTILFDPIGEHKRKQKDEQKKLRKKKTNQRKVSAESSKQITRKSTEEGLSGLSSGSCFREEEYMVFCFQDDGTIHLVKEKRASEASNATSESKQKHRENDENVCRQSYVDADELSDDKLYNAANGQLEEEEGRNDMEVVWQPPDEIKEISHIETHSDDQFKTLSSMLSVADSSDSNRSDASSGSFAFPVFDEQIEMGMDGKPCSHAATRKQRNEGT
ncbi:OLC1v1013254C1 [Oldenlandia corymbosa var. corymbosa]|uniref:OLC1v1013254C1 n=1 Tax=Oldenlandia corymbosa var. corymbosa TaxID=529605 RepID=A0AAV1DXU3_OLDCO|nr:OLC1v1013254C1 [Oldenlandia corymbosa var. corymbosa]